jgi:putative phosphoesterase
MMRIAALYDIHGNLPALEAVLREVRASGADQVVIGGDVVPGPMPRECLQLLGALELPVQCIRGNGDRVVLAAREGGDISEVPDAFRESIRWNGKQIDRAIAEWMAGWPLTARFALGSLGDVVFCHATPHSDTAIFTKSTSADQIQALVDDVNAAVVVCGHTHMQFDRVVGSTRVVNAGSVGMSFQGTGAFWLELSDTVRLRRTEYDLSAAAAAIRATQYPLAETFAARNVLETPTERAMLEAFAKAASTR